MLQRNKTLKVFAKELRKNMTPWERKLWFMFLREYPVRFKRQYIIDNYIVDFYCKEANLVIELDGSGHYQVKQCNKDRWRDAEMELRGLKVLRISNYDIDSNFESVCQKIDELAGGVLMRHPTTKKV